MLIDWLTFDLPYTAATLYSQEFVREWDSELIKPKRPRRHGLKGSYSSALQVMCLGGRMEVHGNPVKYLTGQNIVGLHDIHELILLTYEAVLVVSGLPDCSEAREAIRDGMVNLRRVDCTDHWDVGTDDDCRVFLQAMGERASVKVKGKGNFNSDFCSVGWGFGKDLSNGERSGGSRRSTLKLYNKFDELKRRPMTCAPRHAELLKQWIEGKVRVEACYRGMELQRFNLKLSRDWDEQTPRVLLNKFMDRLEMPDQVTLMEQKELELPRALRNTYDLWLTGRDMQSRMKRTTFYKHKAELLEYGIDISIPNKVTRLPGRTINLVRILEAKPAEFPNAWMFDDLALDGFNQMKAEAQLKRAA